MQAPKVSVIVPVYNVSAFLSQCLNSLKGQTLTDLEVICVDDGSSDGSAEIAARFQAQDPRFRLLRQPHRGVSAARNFGIYQARGSYIAFLDADDWVDPDMLERLWEAAEQTGCDVAVCSSAVHFSGESRPGIRQRRYLRSSLTVKEQIWERSGSSPWCAMALPGSWPFVWNKLIRTDLIRDNALFFSEKLTLGEDGVFDHLLFQYADRAVFVPQALHHYRYQRKASATDNLLRDRQNRFLRHIAAGAEMLREFQSRGLLERNREPLLRWLLDFLYADFVNLPAAARQETADSLEEVFRKYGLIPSPNGLNPVQERRLQTLTAFDRPCTQAKRILDIVWTKLENRLLRLFSQT